MGTVRVTFLGCGSSGGVPRADGAWGACDPNEPRNRRSRCGMLIQRWEGAAGDPRESTSVLIDTSPDLREQLIAAKVSHIDAILYTHDHADQTHGIDDVRAFVLRMRKRIPVWMDEPTRARLMRRFGYCFISENGYPAILEDAGVLNVGEDVRLSGAGGAIDFTPLLQDHGAGMPSLAFRFGQVGYSNDLVAMPEETFAALGELDVWIVDALRYTPHPTHAHLDLALEWSRRLAPKHTILTNLHIDMDYRRLLAELPQAVEPAYDGMALELRE